MGDLVALSGLVEAVEPERLGSTLTAAASAGDTVLQVASTEPFETESGTGRVLIAGTVYDQTEVGVDSSTITITAGLADDMDQDVEVNVSPLSSNVVAKVSTAAGDVITARVATAHIPYLRIGDRDPDEREAVTLYREGQGYVTLDVPNGTAVSDADGLPQIPAEAVAGGGGSGGGDGGNDDDGFVLPTLSEFVFDGDPDYWVTFDSSTHGRVFTEDEASTAFENLYFTEDVEVSAGTITIPLVEVPNWVSPTETTTVYPAWVVPLVGQDSKFTIDSAMAYGMHNRDDPLDPWNGDVQSFLFFASMLDNPTSRTWSEEDQYEMAVTNNTGTGGADQYFIRGWNAGFGDRPLPASSTTETYAAANKRALLIVLPINIVVFGGPPTFTAGSTYTGVRMEQA